MGQRREKSPLPEGSGNQSFDRRLAWYSMTVGATAAMAPGFASGEIIYTDLDPDLVGPPPSPVMIDGCPYCLISIDLDQDGGLDIGISAADYQYYYGLPYFGTYIFDESADDGVGIQYGSLGDNRIIGAGIGIYHNHPQLGPDTERIDAVNLPPGTRIHPTTDFGDATLAETETRPAQPKPIGFHDLAGGLQYNHLSNFDTAGPHSLKDDVDGYLGVEFKIGENTHYGWFRISLDLDTAVATVRDLAYESEPDTPIAAGAKLPGDADFDGDVDLNDFDILTGNYQTGTGWAQGDFDLDGDVDFDDFVIQSLNFGSSVAESAGSESLPEPTSLAMLAAGGVALLRRWRDDESENPRA